MAVSHLNFETNYIYILLSDRGDSYRFHWALYLAKSNTDGVIFHLHNPVNSTTWAYESQPSSDIPDPDRLLLALEVGGVLEPLLHDSLGDRLAQIPIEYSTRFRENITCRVWIKEALFALNNEGYIKLIKSVDAIEEEAKILAMMNKTHRRRTVAKSSGSVA
jgi:hypothetical protein